MSANVSIIVPYLNAERYLSQAIASVQAQTVEDWELLLIDDGSSDCGPSIAATAAALDPRIKLLTRPSGRPAGAASARNFGLQMAQGAFVCFLDADDLFLSIKLETQLSELCKHPTAGMVYGPTQWWHPGSAQRPWLEPLGSYAGKLHAPPKLLNDVILRLRSHVPCTCAVMIRAEVLNAVGGFEERFRLYEDQTLWVKVMQHAPVYVSQTCTALYRQHDQSVSALARDEGLYDRMKPHAARQEFLDWIEAYVAADGHAKSTTARGIRLARARELGQSSGLSLADRLAVLRDRLPQFGSRVVRALRYRLRRSRPAG